MTTWNTSPVDEYVKEEAFTSENDLISCENDLIQVNKLGSCFFNDFVIDGIKSIWKENIGCYLNEDGLVIGNGGGSSWNNNHIESEILLDIRYNSLVICVTLYGDVRFVAGYFDGTYPNSMLTVSLNDNNRNISLVIGGSSYYAQPSMLMNLPPNNNSSHKIYLKLKQNTNITNRSDVSISLDGNTWEDCGLELNDYYYNKIRLGIFSNNTTNLNYPNTGVVVHSVKQINNEELYNDGFVDNFDENVLNPRWTDSLDIFKEQNKVVFGVSNTTTYSGNFTFIKTEPINSALYEMNAKITLYGACHFTIGDWLDPYYYSSIYIDTVAFRIGLINGGYSQNVYPKLFENFEVDANNIITVYIKTQWEYVNNNLSIGILSASLDGVNWEDIIRSSWIFPTYPYHNFHIGTRRVYIINPNYPDRSAELHYVKVIPYPEMAEITLKETESYTALLPAKLAKVLTIQSNITIAGNGGNINLLVQHKSDEDETWVSLTDIPNEWTDLGTIDGTAITVPDYLSRTNDKFRYKLLYSGDGLNSYPEIDKVTFTWESDVTAPSEPVITTAISSSESILTILFADLLPDAYAVIFELNINGAGSLPFSERGKIESGYGYMRFVGSKTEIEQQAERNGLVTSIKGLQEGDIVVITAFARDNVGNISAGKTKSIMMSGAQYLTMLTEIISEVVTPTIVTDSVKEI